MAKYWVFQNNQVNGPYAAEELTQVAGFSLESLVCPEGRKGTNMGDWQRASLIPELSSVSTQASRYSATLQVSEPTRSGFGLEAASPNVSHSLPAEGLRAETLDKVSMLETTVSQLNEQLQTNHEDLLNLHKILDNEKTLIAQGASEISAKIGSLEEKISKPQPVPATAGNEEMIGHMKSLEEKISSLSALRENMEATISAQKDLEALVKNQAKSIEDMSKGLQDLQNNLSSIGNKTEPAPTANFEPSLVTHFEAPPAASFPQSQTFSAPPAESEPQSGMPPFAVVGFPAMAETPSPEISQTPTFPLASEALGSANEPTPMPTPVKIPESTRSAEFPPKPKVKKGKPFLWFGGAFLVVGALLAYEEGFIPMGASPRKPSSVLDKASQPAPVVNTQPPVTPAANVTASPAPVPQPIQNASADLKKKAIQLVSTWPITGSKATVGEALAKAYPSKGSLNPWMAEKIIDGIYKVDFYASKGRGPAQHYEFEAHLNESQVLPKNKMTQRLMVPHSTSRRRRPRVKLKHKAARASDQAIFSDSNQPAATAGLPGFADSNRPAKNNAQGAQAEHQSAQPQAAPTQAQPQQPEPNKASDAQLLDNLLKP